MDQVPNGLDAVGQTWVEGALKAEAALPSFRLTRLDAQNSHTGRLIFAGPTPGPFPVKSLILKLCPEGHGFLGASEPTYYTRDYSDLSDAPLVKCHRAIWSGAPLSQSLGNGYALFLEDLTETHTDNKLIAPDAAHAALLGQALGRLHAHRWGHDADSEGAHDLKADLQRYLAHVSRGLGPICDAMGDDLDPAARARLEQTFTEDADIMLSRAQRGGGVTLVHGDPNPTNVLTRKGGAQNGRPLYLIDRQPFEWTLRVWLGASDLVYAAVLFWPEDLRRALQTTLLTTYHKTLLEGGVRSYSRDDLQEDWRASACIAAFTAIEWGSDPGTLGPMRWLWERQLRRALALLEDCDKGNG